MRVERVLLAVGDHPLGHQRPAARDDSGDPMGRERDVVAEDAGVDRHVVDALLGLVLDHVEHVLGGEVLDLLDLLDRLVDRHGADRDRAGRDDRLADRVDVAAGREVHHRVGAELDGQLELGELVVDVRGHRRVADVRVDLASRLDADAHRLQAQLQMHRVGRDDHPAARDFRADQLGIEVLAAGHEFHLGRDNPLAGHFDLRHCQASSQSRSHVPRPTCRTGSENRAISRYRRPVTPIRSIVIAIKRPSRRMRLAGSAISGYDESRLNSLGTDMPLA